MKYIGIALATFSFILLVVIANATFGAEQIKQDHAKLEIRSQNDCLAGAYNPAH